MRKTFFVENMKDFTLLEKYFSLTEFNERLDVKKLINLISLIDMINDEDMKNCDCCKNLKTVLLKQNAK